MSSLLLPALNLLALIALLAYFLRQPVSQFSRDRHHQLRTSLSEAKEQLDRARARLEEVNAKARALTSEVASLRSQMAEEAQRMSQKIQTGAQNASSSILQDAKRASESLAQEFKLELRRELAFNITQRASALISQKLTTAGREKVRKDFVGYLGAST